MGQNTVYGKELEFIYFQVVRMVIEILVVHKLLNDIDIDCSVFP